MVSEAHRLILWDVDGTLMTAGPVGRTVFDAAVATVLGRVVDGHDVQMSGKTDPQIALEILATMAVHGDEAAAHLPKVLRALEGELETAVDLIREQGRVHPGVVEVLASLDAEPGVRQSVLTGNLRANALLKVGAFGLDRWLDLEAGAYGSDDADRTRLVPVALARLAELRGFKIQRDRVWVVGDTPADLACARAGGVRCLLVATGRIPLDELVTAGPDAVLNDLSDLDRVRSILLGPAGVSG
jgi:phosphoglycolate phosphatase-like HAD superfamily hydrolase